MTEETASRKGLAFRTAYGLITADYGDRWAERSGVPLMNHIDEGLSILRHLGASNTTQAAWCLHPLVQADQDLLRNHAKLLQRPELSTPLFVAMEYRNQANAWLSDKVSKGWFGRIKLAGRPSPGPLDSVWLLLVADKVQNRKDFLAYQDDHPRRDELAAYFDAWLAALEISETMYQHLCAQTHKKGTL